VKELTGGDPIRARFMRQDHFEFQPTHHVWLACNHKPTIRGTDEGVWRRIKLTPFTVTIPEDQQDRELPDKLAAEASGILNWALLGCLEWQADGLGEPEEVRRATTDYRNEQDVVALFLSECCIEAAQCRVKAGELYGAYTAWCERTGEYAHNQRRFGAALTERGLRRTKNSGVWYEGVRLLAA
jgi:putative DNA primase/helicase